MLDKSIVYGARKDKEVGGWEANFHNVVTKRFGKLCQIFKTKKLKKNKNEKKPDWNLLSR